MPTVILGSARDVVEHCGVPRFLFTDFPLGNPCGTPYDRDMQYAITGLALDVLDRAKTPRHTVQSDYSWGDDQSWREGYLQVRGEDAARLALLGRENRSRRERLKSAGKGRDDA
ncbi:MAG: hypothetical protein O7E57_16980 [Gammaproteobacteria bacterium]|nr:hypothetical protein [Gammaproteobacteria bacterium]